MIIVIKMIKCDDLDGFIGKERIHYADYSGPPFSKSAGSPYSKDDSSTCSYSHQIAAPLITPAKELNFAGDGFIGKDRNSTFGRSAGSLRWCPPV